jgi:hypothetical protein
MKKQGKSLKSMVTLALLPFVATAAVSAQQWMTDNAPIGVANVEAMVEAKTFISHRMHTIALNRMGAVEGRVANIDPATQEVKGISNLKVFFIDNGLVVKEAITGRDGVFVVEGLMEGSYSFVASGSDGFAAYGVRVVAEGFEGASNIMEAATVSPELSVVKQMLAEQLPQQVTEEIIAAIDTDADRSVGANRVRLINGTLQGRVTPIKGESAEGTVVHLLKNNEQLAELIVQKDGSFVVEDLVAGVYQFVATGSAGFAAVSFVAIDAAGMGDSDEMPVAATRLISDSEYFDVSLAAAQDAVFASDSIAFGGGDSGFGIADSFGFGGSSCSACTACNDCGGRRGLLGRGGFGGPGGGLLGSGGSLGSLLAIGGLAGGIVGIASSGDRPPASESE